MSAYQCQKCGAIDQAPGDECYYCKSTRELQELCDLYVDQHEQERKEQWKLEELHYTQQCEEMRQREHERNSEAAARAYGLNPNATSADILGKP